jgi:glycerophosphoryl diester phosphodiesterase
MRMNFIEQKISFVMALVVCGFALLISACQNNPSKPNETSKLVVSQPKQRPLVIGHRGASGTYPDHTMEAYLEAMRVGADIVEPDLVITKDGVLICRHENDLTQTTNVSVVFPKRKKTKVIDGQSITGWFAEDFTLKEIRQLRARQPIPFRNQEFNDQFSVATFDELLVAVTKEAEKNNRIIGIYPETKHPSYFQSIRLPLEEKLLLALKKRGFPKRLNPVYIQSFEITNLKKIRTSKNYSNEYNIVQLFDDAPERPYDQVLINSPLTYQQMMSPEGLAQIATYAHGIGPWKRLIRAEAPDKSLLRANDFVQKAHDAGLFVHAYTFRSEPFFLNGEYQNNPEKEYFDFFNIGVDGVFSDFPAAAKDARDKWLAQ